MTPNNERPSPLLRTRCSVGEQKNDKDNDDHGDDVTDIFQTVSLAVQGLARGVSSSSEDDPSHMASQRRPSRLPSTVLFTKTASDAMDDDHKEREQGEDEDDPLNTSNEDLLFAGQGMEDLLQSLGEQFDPTESSSDPVVSVLRQSLNMAQPRRRVRDVSFSLPEIREERLCDDERETDEDDVRPAWRDRIRVQSRLPDVEITLSQRRSELSVQSAPALSPARSTSTAMSDVSSRYHADDGRYHDDDDEDGFSAFTRLRSLQSYWSGEDDLSMVSLAFREDPEEEEEEEDDILMLAPACHGLAWLF